MRIKATLEMAATHFDFQDPTNKDGKLEQGNLKGQTITHGSLKQGLWKVSWPILVTASCLSIVDLVHVQCAGTLSTKAQAMIGVCDQFMLLCVIVITSLSTAGTAIASKAYGAKSHHDVAALTGQMLGLMIAIAIIMIVIVLTTSTLLLSSFSGCVNNCGATIDEGKQYLDLVAFFLIPCAVVSTINAVFVGMGNARVQLLTLSSMTGIDILVNYLLMIKGWPIADVGITGIATASILGYSVAAILAAVAWWKYEIRQKSKSTAKKGVDGDSSIVGPEFERKNSEATTKPKSYKFIGPILTNGVPAALQDIAWCSSTFVLFWILSLIENPAEAVAAWTIGQRLEAFALLPLSGLSMASLVAVGQNIGSNRISRAWKASCSSAALAVCLLVLTGALLFIFATTLSQAATTDKTTQLVLACYLRVAAFGLPFAALEAVLGSSLQALNDSRVPMIFSFVSNWVIGLSLSYLLAISFAQGASGAWLGLAISTGITGTLVTLRFFTKAEWLGFSPMACRARQAEGTNSIVQMDAQIDNSANSLDGQKPVTRGKLVQELDLPIKETHKDSRADIELP